MEDFLKFRKFITPMIIQIVFWLGVVGMVIVGLIGIGGGIAGNNLGAAFGGFLTLIFGPIGVRIYCELLIVAFRILDVLTEIRNNTQRPGGMV